MKGHKFLKVTGILMIIAAVFSIIAGVLVGGQILGLRLGGGRTRCGIRSDISILGGVVPDAGRRNLPDDCRNQRH